MKFITAKKEETVFVGMVDEGKVLHLRKLQKAMTGKATLPITMLECIEHGDEFIAEAAAIRAWAKEQAEPNGVYTLEEVKLLAPIPRPRKNIICVGKNYTEHAIEMGGKDDVPEHLIFFTKAPTAVIGHEEYINRYESLTDELDYEGELAVIIGKRGRGISPDDALDYVFGYTIINDVTARDVQTRHKQYFLGKSFDTFCPMGPVLVHRTNIENPNNLSIETKVSGDVRQSSNTKHMIFNIQTILSTLSQGMTLEPGDVIATGTPAGVGKGMEPPGFLQKGDTVEITVDGIGTLRNNVK